jgi:hypothetical protein
MSWTPPVHTLLCPIDSPERGTLTEIAFKAFSHGEHAKIVANTEKDKDDGDRREEQLIQLATGLTDAELEQLKRPDYLSLTSLLYEYVNNTAAHYLGDPEDADAPPLLQPISVMGQELTSLTLEMPAVKATKVMAKQKTAQERTDFISAHCSGLGVVELGLLSVPDWNTLQLRLNHFLNQPASFFQNATSK